ncbi:MAG: DJ-1/PfpI family protein [Thalassobaculaceae bacterium]|nr:DJ-1/PfpI family protein [Thalassobaculaceae bacterium]
MAADATRFAILAYDGIEPIDIGATYGVLSMAKRIVPTLSFFVVSKSGGELVMANGLRLLADHGFDGAPAADILMVLGGPGWGAACEDRAVLDYIRDFHAGGGTVAAVCTGGMIVGAAGLLDGRRATTKREIVPGEARPLDLLAERYAMADVVEARLVDEGDVLTGGGVSLGIDMTLHLIEKTCGVRAAAETARILEYATAWDANRRTFRAL